MEKAVFRKKGSYEIKKGRELSRPFAIIDGLFLAGCANGLVLFTLLD